MNEPLVCEGTDLEQLLADIRSEHGDNAKILYQDSVRRGGVMGFFAQEVHRIVFRVQDGQQKAPAHSADTADDAEALQELDPFQALLHSVIHTPENIMASASPSPHQPAGSHAAGRNARAASAYSQASSVAATPQQQQDEAAWLESLLLPAEADEVHANAGAHPYAFPAAAADVAVVNRKPAHAAAEPPAFTEVGTGSRPYSTVEFEVMKKFPVIQTAQERFAELLQTMAEEQAAQQAAAEEQAALEAAARQAEAREAAEREAAVRDAAAQVAAAREAAARESAARESAEQLAAVREAAAREAMSRASSEALERVAVAREAVAAAAAEIAAARLAAAQEEAAREAAAERQAAESAAAAAAREAAEVATAAAAAQHAAQVAELRAAAAQEAAQLAARKAAEAEASAESALRAAPAARTPRPAAALAVVEEPLAMPAAALGATAALGAVSPTAAVSPAALGAPRESAQVVNLPSTGTPVTRARLDLSSRLREAGVPATLQPSAATTISSALEEVLAALPEAPTAPRRPGDVLVIVGEAGPALRAAQSVARSLRVQDEDIWIADLQFHPILQIGGAALSRQNSLTSARQASRVRGELLLNDVASVVVLATDGADAADPWIGEMLEALRPTAVWACVDATRKPSDTAASLALLGDIDALVVHSAAISTSPASVLELGIAVALLENRPATPANWGGLLRDLLHASMHLEDDAAAWVELSAAGARHRSA